MADDERRDESSDTQVREFPCKQCGAKLEFKPGADALVCPYCDFHNPLPESDEVVEELDYHSFLRQAADEEEQVAVRVVRCEACAGETTLDPNVTAGECAFCGSPLVTQETETTAIKPRSLLPFAVDREKARQSFREWLKSLWFAPGGLAKYARVEEAFSGVYTPYWTYDSSTTSQYRGERGDDYWTTETYTEKDADGKTVTKTRQVKKTRWTSVSGSVYVSFNDLLVLGSHTLPEWMVRKIEPWDLHELAPYDDNYLAGYRAERYSVDLEEGFDRAKEMMVDGIHREIRSDIGGDHQRIHGVNTRYYDITFKHILLPVWLSAFRYRDKPYRFLVNGRTGAVAGERPWSTWKIVALVLVIVVVVAALVAGFALAGS
jgi:uncharacterized CHY-type Zn-finger protein